MNRLKPLGILLLCLFELHGFAQLTPSHWNDDGNSSGGRLGRSVASGDFDGDGYTDIVATELTVDKAHVYYGKAEGFGSSPDLTLQPTTSYQFGFHVAVGDLDDDGYDDVAISTTGSAAGTGRVYLYYGSPTGLLTYYVKITTLVGGQNFGWNLDIGGDFDGNGKVDLAIGAPARDAHGTSHPVPFYSTVSGVYVYYGENLTKPSSANINLDSDDADWKKEQSGVYEDFGWSVALAGDLTKDGQSELLVGDPFVYSDEGCVFVIGRTFSGSLGTLTVIEGSSSSQFGRSVAGLDDVDGDADGDFIVGSPAVGNSNDAGEVYVFLGGFTPANGLGLSHVWSDYTDANWNFSSPIQTGNDAHFGWEVCDLGDVNHDDKDDFGIAARGYDDGANAEVGLIRIYYGNGSSQPTSFSDLKGANAGDWLGFDFCSFSRQPGGRGYLLAGSPKFDAGSTSDAGRIDIFGDRVERAQQGWATVNLGDITGDGLEDFAVSSPGIGLVEVFQSTTSGFNPTPIYEFDLGGNAGFSMAAIDIDKNGLNDLLIADDEFNDDQGIVYVFLNQNPGFLSAPSSTIISPNTNENFGYSMVNAGDIDGDGFDDVVIGAPGSTSNVGKAYVFKSDASGYDNMLTSPVPHVTLTKPGATNSMFGYSVAGNASVNSDSYADIAVGEADQNNVYLYEGTATTLSTTPVWTGQGPSASQFGYSLSFGKVDNDAFYDLVVGAPFDPNSSCRGRVYVWTGEATVSWSSSYTTADWNSGNGYGPSNGRFGHSIDATHDLDGDGLHDIAVGNPYYVFVGGNTGYGNVSLCGFDYNTSTLKIKENTVGSAPSGYSNHGWSITAIADLNSDFVSEIVVGAPWDDNDGTDDGSFSMKLSNKRAPSTIIGLGDISGDGLEDFAVGIPADGKIEIYTTTTSGYNTTPQVITLGGNAGISLASVDFDLNGEMDLLVGDDQYDNGKGAVYVFLQTTSGFTSTPDFKILGTRANGNLGHSLASLDASLIIGEPGEESDDGNVYLFDASSSYQNSSTDLSTSSISPTFTIANSQLGLSVANAGNVDGKYGNDVLAGDANADKVYLFLEGSSGFSLSPDWTASHTANSLFGSALSGGDLNGDGFSDIAVGAPLDELSASTGRVYVWYGSESVASWPTNPVNADWNSGAGYGSEGSEFGASVLISPSIGRDDLNDLLVGVPYYENSGHSGLGAVKVYYGSLEGLGCSQTEVSESPFGTGPQLYGGSLASLDDLNGDGVGEFLVGAVVNNSSNHTFLNFGSTLTWVRGGLERSAGDVNGDGYGDVLSINQEEYQVMLYHGGPSGLSSSHTWARQFCSVPSVKTAGDVNGDGYSDIIIGVPNYNSGDGAAYIYTGSSEGIDAALWTAFGQATEEFGKDVAVIGHANSDDYSDVAVGAPGANKVYFFTGTTDALWRTNSGKSSSTASLSIQPSANFQNFGTTVSGAGDVNGDGLSDVVIGDPFIARVHLVLGWGTGSPAIAKTIEDDINPASQFGASLSYAGDLNGDGYSDVVVGAPMTPVVGGAGGLLLGQAYVFLGPHGGWQASTSLSPIILTSPGGASDQFGYTVSCLGDVNADGFSDIAVGAPFAEVNGNADAGAAYIYLGGGQFILNAVVDHSDVISGNLEEEYKGQNIHGLGDINGDGISEYNHSTYDYQNDVWSRTLVKGTTSLLTDDPTGTITKSGFYSYGLSVSNAGDVNGDGYDDLLVSAPEDAYSSQTGGIVYVHHGNAAGTYSVTPNWTGYLDYSTGLGGFSTASGDVNGDGYSDIVVGAPGLYDCNRDGAVYVFFGSKSGISEGRSVDEFMQPFATGSWPSTYVRILGEKDVTGPGFGYDVACMDINGDGVSDIVSCAPSIDVSATSPAVYRSKFYVFLGRNTSNWQYSMTSCSYSGQMPLTGGGSITISYEYMLASAADITIERPEAVWAKVENAGDIKNNGFSDLMISYGNDVTPSATEAVEVFYGQCEGLSGSNKLTSLTTSNLADWKAVLGTAVNKFGFSMAGLGDVDGDGYGDIAIGAPEFSNGLSGKGIVYVLKGASGGLPGNNNGSSNNMSTTNMINNVWLAESNEDEGFGFSISGAGDVNGLGHNDLIVSTKYWADADDNRYHLYLFAAEKDANFFVKGTKVEETDADWNHGVSSTTNGHNSNNPNSIFSLYEFEGLSVSSLGDIGGDGYGDIVAGVPYAVTNPSSPSWNPFIFYYGGNEALSISTPTVQYQNFTTSSGGHNVMTQTGTASDHCGVNIGHKGISHLGRSQGKFVWEVIAKGDEFATVSSDPELLNYYAEGIATSSPVLDKNSSFERIDVTHQDEFEPNSGGDVLNTTTAISGNYQDLSYRWRCRMKYQPSLAIDGQAYGRWYYPGLGDKHNGNFKVECSQSVCGNVPFEEQVGVEELVTSESSLSVYPNPVQNTLNIISEDVIKQVRVFNLIGEQIMVVNGGQAQNLQIDASSLIQGLYLVEVEDVDGNLHSTKIEK